MRINVCTGTLGNQTRHTFLYTFDNNLKFCFFQIGRDNRDDVEQNIREALEDFCRPENLERELRKAMDTLNIDNKSKEE